MASAKNILLLFLSDYKPSGRDEPYWFRGRKYIGSQTNDAPTKLLLDLAKEEGRPITDVICIASDKAKSDEMVDGSKSSYARFEEMIGIWAKDSSYDDPIEITPILYDMGIVDIDRRTRLLYRQFNEALDRIVRESGETNVYIDYTGGLRDTSFFMTVIIRYLEFSGIKCRKIVYSKWERELAEDNILYDITFIYELFQLINGASEFAGTGNATTLKMLYEDTDNAEIKDVLEGLISFSNKMSLCRIGDVDDAITSLSVSLGKLERYTEKTDESLYSDMFSSLVPLIRSKMGIRSGENTIEIPKLILWCLDNGMIQQAVTLYIEKMPEYYLDNKMIPYALFDWDKDVATNLGGSQAATKIYSTLFDVIQAKADPVLKLKVVLEEIDVAEIRRTKDPDKVDEVILLRMAALQKTHPQFERQIAELRNLMKMIMNPDSKAAKHKKIYGKGLNRKASSLYMDAVNMNAVRHFLLYHDKERFEQYKRENDMGTHAKKVLAIKGVNKVDDLDEQEKQKLKSIMAYYEIAKIIRNKLNHANDAENNEDEMSALEYFAKEGFIQGIDIMDYYTISSILQRGLEETTL